MCGRCLLTGRISDWKAMSNDGTLTLGAAGAGGQSACRGHRGWEGGGRGRGLTGINRGPEAVPGLPFPSPAVSLTHNGQRRWAWPVVGFDLGGLVGVRGLGGRELG